MVSRASLTTGLISLGATAALLLLPGSARAEGPEESDDFSLYEQLLLLGFEDSGIDTGWIPQGSPVQMRFFAEAANSVTMDLPGEAIYDWESETLRFEGEPDAGSFEYDVGLEIFASVKIDLGIVQWESNILGPYDWDLEAIAPFTPYLLEGNPDRPAQVEDMTGALPLASVPIIPDIILVSGNLDIDLFIEVEAEFECNRIEVEGTDGELTLFVLEGEALVMDPGEGEGDLVLPATAFCQLRTAPTLIINPHLVMSVIGQEFDIAGIDIPIDLPVIDDEIGFETIDLSFPRWEAPPPEEGDTGEGDGESESDSGDSGDEIGDEGDTGTGTGDSGGELSDDGCNCAAPGRGAPRAWLGLGLLGLGLAGRRRRQSIR